MDTLLKVRGMAKKIYSEYETPIRIVLKFIFILFTLNYITAQIGYYELLNLLPIRLFIAVLSAFLPVSIGVFIVAVVAIIQLFKLSVLMGALAAILFIIAYFLYLKFAPEQGIFVLAMIVLAPLNLHYAVALILGLFFGPATIVPSAMAMILISFVRCMKSVAEAMGSGFNIESMMAGYQEIIDGVMGDKNMILAIIVVAVVIILAYVISKIPFDYSWYVAIGVAAVAGIIVDIAGASVLGADSNAGSAVVGLILGAVIAVIFQFFKCIVDYPKKEYLQFEDDEYYYYVKAIPKLGVDEEYEADEDDEDDEYVENVRPKSNSKTSKAKTGKADRMTAAQRRALKAEKNVNEFFAASDDSFAKTDYETKVPAPKQTTGAQPAQRRNRNTTVNRPVQSYDDGLDFDLYDYDDDEPKF